MTIKTVSVVAPKVGPRGIGGSITEDKNARAARMSEFWSDKVNAVLIIVGYFLKTVEQGKTLAQWLVEGEEITLQEISIGGKVFPLVDGFVLSLKTLSIWGCPACHSAHGSGVYPSRAVDAEGLEGNKFYYNPVTKQLSVISDTCWSRYVVDLMATKHIVEVAKYKPAKA